MGNYPGTGIVAGVGRGVSLADWPADTNRYMSNYQFTPYVQGPKSAHVMWKRQGVDGGIIGGTVGIASWQSGGGGPTIIFQGRCYQTVTKVFNGATPERLAMLRLANRRRYIWEKTGITQIPTMIMYSEREMEVVPGETSSTLP